MIDSIVGDEFLPNVHIEKITYQPTSIGKTITRVEVALYDHQQRTWSADEKFTQYLSVIFLPIINRKTIQKIKEGERSLGRTSSNRKTASFSSFEGPIETVIKSKTYIRYKKI